jgi:hypothetical protein
MSTKTNTTSSLRNGVLLAGAIAASVGIALVVDGTQSSPAVAETTPGVKDPAAAQQLPPNHPPVGADDGSMADGQELPPGHPPIDGNLGADQGAGMEMPAGHPPTNGAAQAASIAPGSIAPAQGEGAVTVSKLIGQAASYEGKKVRIAAKVMRSTVNVLGKTWLHVSDGSGSAERGDHDLVVTTQAEPQIGDIVVIEGVVSRNKDLGSGYRYDVLVEDATLTPRPAG